MDISTASVTAADFIAARESFSQVPYWDVNGYAIGYGNHYYEDGSAVSGDDDPITEIRARQLLNFYVNQNAAAIAGQVLTPLSPNELAALTSLRYNCGTITQTLLGLINSGSDPRVVADQLRETCTTSGGISDPVLIDRRNLEAELYLSQAGLGTGILVVAVLGLGLYALFSK